uniref:Uncharacterized protein n=1 Tax=Physcomitrium patens TaxID=3218 RepID=A0A2K1KAD8_PHYPA|nr:hypothetical protein PHYPA_009928 [Physcomitrium patens]
MWDAAELFNNDPSPSLVERSLHVKLGGGSQCLARNNPMWRSPSPYSSALNFYAELNRLLYPLKVIILAR